MGWHLSPLKWGLLLFAGGAVAGIIGEIAVAAVDISLGGYDVSASTPHSRLMAWGLHTTMIRSIQTRARGGLPDNAYGTDVEPGFREYEAHCVMCHGGPGVARAPWVKGLTPTPPYLIDAPRRWSAGELDFIIDHGIKMTAMPAWGLTLTPAEIGNLVAFLEQLPDTTPRQYAAMRAKLCSGQSPCQ